METATEQQLQHSGSASTGPASPVRVGSPPLPPGASSGSAHAGGVGGTQVQSAGSQGGTAGAAGGSGRGGTPAPGVHPSGDSITAGGGRTREGLAVVGGKLQQLGHKLLNAKNLTRKKQASFAAGGYASAGASSSGGTAPGPAGAAALAGDEGGTVSGAAVFSPPNHPVNPFSYLAKPFHVMAKTKAGASVARYATTALKLRREGTPPASYMSLWLGNFKRWQRRYLVASEAPGVLLIYKHANLKGKVWSISLCDAGVDLDEQHPRQIKLATHSGTIFLRVLRPEERRPWMACLQGSIDTFRHHKEVVEGLASVAGTEGDPAGAAKGGAAGAAGVVASDVDQDAEQRRRIRIRVNERVAELAPLAAEVERHMNAAAGQLAAAAAGMALGRPLLAPPAHMGRGLGFAPSTSINARALHEANVLLQGHAAAAGAGAAGGLGLPPHAEEDALERPQPATAAATPTPSSAPATAEATPRDAAADPHASPPGSGPAAAAAALAPGGPTGPHVPPPISSLSRISSIGRPPSELLAVVSRARSGRTAARSAGAPSLAGAVSALMDAVRATLHNEAVRVVALEMENAALNKTLLVMRTVSRSVNRSRASVAGGPGAQSQGPAAGAQRGGGGADDADSVTSACTADEDAFDVVEAFDEDVDYSILEDDAPHLHGRLGIDDDSPYVRCAPPDGDDDDFEEDDEDDAEDAAIAQAEAEALHALEVVRQVEYIAASRAAGRFTELLAASTPPPPDAHDDGSGGGTGGAGRRKKREAAKRGEDTDTTQVEDDEDFDDDEVLSDEAMEEAAGGAGAGGTARASGTAVYAPRARLPAPKPLGRGFSIWTILKNMIGKDLTKITMPATINEPLSMTQRMCEVLENRELLDRASAAPSSTERMMLVAVWLLAGYNSQPLRDNKPFNPLLGETFEWRAPGGDAWYLSEQVSHHPPITCFQAEGGGDKGYSVFGELETRTKFWGKSIELVLMGHCSVRLKAYNEEYRFNLGTLLINDVILGRFWIDLGADMKIRNVATGNTARLIIKPCRGVLKDRGRSEGTVWDANGMEAWRITGNCMEALYAQPTAQEVERSGAAADRQLVWTRKEGVPDPREQYFMTPFALSLNDPADPNVPSLPPTDVRFRPDMRALELGEWNRATSEKLRLEEKQRTVRRLRKEAGQEYQPLWFKQLVRDTKELTQPSSSPGSVWAYTGQYWDKRAQQAWADCPDLY